MINSRIQSSDTGIMNTRNSSSQALTGTNAPQSGNSTAGLEKGQLIQGEVTDLRNNEISVKLDDGRVLTGKLEGSRDLSIGDRVTFRVEDVSLKNLTLKIISNGNYISADSTIEKALTEGGFAKNTRNNEIVRELLNQQMSIDKQTISLLIRQSLLHKDTPIQTLILMNKYNIPVTEGNIRQFQIYQNSEQSILNSLDMVSDSIINLFAPSDEVTYDQYLSRSSELLKLLTNSNANGTTTENTITDNSQPLTELNNTYNSTTSPVSLNSQATQTVGNLLSQDEIKDLLHLMKSNPELEGLLGNKFISSLADGSVAISIASEALKQLLSFLKESANGSGLMNKLTSSLSIQKILSAGEAIQTQPSEQPFFMMASDKLKLTESLEKLISDQNPDSVVKEEFHMLKDRIMSGRISSKEILDWISLRIDTGGEESVQSLFSSKEFRMLLKDHLLNQWTLNPREITKNESIEKHFEDLANQLNSLKELAQQISGEKGNHLAGQVNNFKEGMDFIQNLNQIFTYIPLPLKLKNQFKDGELYVYSKKKPGRTTAHGISVLLHLNMDHLGPLDIYLNLKEQHLNSKFYLEDESTMNFISSNLYQLEEVLKKKGYTIDTEVFKREKEVNVVEDILKADTQISSVTRYKFDLRA